MTTVLDDKRLQTVLMWATWATLAVGVVTVVRTVVRLVHR